MDMEEENCSKKRKIGNDEPQIEMKPSTGNSKELLMKPTNSEGPLMNLSNNSEELLMKPINSKEPQMQPTNSEEPQIKTSFSNSEKSQLEPSNSEKQRTKLGGKTYCVQYENNNSKRWDIKECKSMDSGFTVSAIRVKFIVVTKLSCDGQLKKGRYSTGMQ